MADCWSPKSILIMEREQDTHVVGSRVEISEEISDRSLPPAQMWTSRSVTQTELQADTFAPISNL